MPARSAVVMGALAACALLGWGSGPAHAGCHLIDCVEAVRISARDLRGADCERLWTLRNSIYKDAGYCFRTARAISHFGNAGCRHDDIADVRLSATMRHNIGVLKGLEGRKSCE